ncbi:aldehyde dehydrogenase family protein, partial [Mesorhizobium sp. M7A.F.Ca.US.006.01.1.1]|uniref:aldehyde dehydrogenase family protein n=1 Tax=Mesorhizobium sp. M7A.F.Ca.US.006.01.1.1 TaxID=2496707 RepID=UPI0013E29739
MQEFQHYIDGRFVAPAGGEFFDSFNPYTGKPWARIARGNAADVDMAVDAAESAFLKGPWGSTTASERGALLRKIGDILAREAE